MTKTILSLTVIVCPGGLAGCELALDFDRTLVDGGVITADASFFDAAPAADAAPKPDGSSDAGDATAPQEASTADASIDASFDAGADATDASTAADASDASDASADDASDASAD